MQQIKKGIYYEDSFLGVTLGALVFSQGIILIDAPLRAEDARSWRSTLLNQRGGMSRLLVFLDPHIDRTLGSRMLESTIIAHQKTAHVFRSRPTVFKGQSYQSGSEWENYTEAIGTRWAAPDIIFTHKMSLHMGGPEVVLEHHPGPAPGATWVVIPEEQVIFVGDAVMLNQPAFLANADLEAWAESLDLLLGTYKNYLVISGRGGPAAHETLREQQHFLKSVMKGMEKLAKRNAAPDSTEQLISGLLNEIDYPSERTELYTQRLRVGLYQYYIRHYRPNTINEQSEYQNGEDFSHG